jgi:hypothetical protein
MRYVENSCGALSEKRGGATSNSDSGMLAGDEVQNATSGMLGRDYRQKSRSRRPWASRDFFYGRLE